MATIAQVLCLREMVKITYERREERNIYLKQNIHYIRNDINIIHRQNNVMHNEFNQNVIDMCNRLDNVH